jgi:hypothetical protein
MKINVPSTSTPKFLKGLYENFHAQPTCLWNDAIAAELDVDLLDRGFTLSEALKKKVLSEIKLADLTIGDLAKLGAGPSEPESNSGSIFPLRRRP